MRALLILLLAGLPALAPAQSLPEGEHLLAPVPQGFVLGHEGEDATGLLQEFVPAGERVEDWSQMMTVRVLRQIGGTHPVAWHNNLVELLLQVCPTATAQEVAGGEEQGTPFHLILVGCPASPATGGEEWFLSKAMGGRDALYNVQGAWRGPATEALVTAWAGHLRTVLVCDTRRADAPCPGTGP
ncbi:hypothetical protein N8I71_10015 [Roseibacterium sp. SDUM158016]|jgi:hypothetical protein|uniref:hypothetical protein n=1 Tax=Roseicyclus sediminis TaxID=2980997 RepID=UPI0021D1D2BA|nr:hypothetical protein [Roseibacterium sp. SDUM158016]MCU4653168.1 hypothetical protein [Roseibacterium sp. SDUM158016]